MDKLEELKWLKFEKYWKLELLTITHKVLVTSLSTYLENEVVIRNKIHDVNICNAYSHSMPQNFTARFQKILVTTRSININALDQNLKQH